MAEEQTTPKASKPENTTFITVDIKEANDASISESLTTPTPSKTHFNANAVEFVPGQFRAAAAPNPAAPVFTPQFQLTPGGYVPINPYAVPYYMYVPTNGAGAPVGATEDGTVVVSPVMTYQTRGAPYMGGKGGLARHNSSGARSARSDGPVRGKGFRAAPVKETPKEEIKSDSPVIKPEEFPSMLGSAVKDESKEESSKPSWAAIAKKPSVPKVTPASPVLRPATTVLPPAATVLPPASPKKQPEMEPLTLAPESPRVDLPKEPAASALPVSGKPKLAPWARGPVADEASPNAAEPAPAVMEQKPVEAAVEEKTSDESEPEPVTTEANMEEPVIEASPVEASEDSVTEGERLVYSIDLLKRLRYHESCRPSAEVRSSLPNGLLRQRGIQAEEADDWRAEAASASRGRGRRGLSRSMSSRIEISAEMLIPSENSWSAAQQKKDESLDENVKVGRRIFAVLNKLTVEKFAKLSDQLFTECGIARPAHIVTLVKLLFDKATMQHHFIPMYAELCSKCLAWLGSDAAPEELVNSIGPGERSTAVADIFRRVLLERCQERFYSYFMEQAAEAKAERSDEEHHKHRLSMLGTVRLVAQLLEHRLMTRAVFRNCLEILLNPEERTDDHLECACVFLGEIGRLFDQTENPDQYSKALEDAMDELTEIAEDDATAPRIKFTIMNLVDLRANGYQVKALPGQAAGPTKISDVHKQAAKEEQLVRSMSRASQAPTNNLTDEWETVLTRKSAVSHPK